MMKIPGIVPTAALARAPSLVVAARPAWTRSALLDLATEGPCGALRRAARTSCITVPTGLALMQRRQPERKNHQ